MRALILFLTGILDASLLIIDDFHYPTLTVRQTLEMALKTKTPSKRLQDHRKDFVKEFLDVLTKMYGLTKQVDTVVGNAFIRGISGGERKRLSIAEQMATRSSVNMWDGSTRGLDASSALDYAKSLRVQTVREQSLVPHEYNRDRTSVLIAIIFLLNHTSRISSTRPPSSLSTKL